MSTGVFLKVPILWNDYKEGAVAQQTMERSASGELLVSLGKAFRSWFGVFKVSGTPGAGYATRENIEAWGTSSNAAKRRLIMRTNLWVDPGISITGEPLPSPYEFTVFITMLGQAQLGSPVPDGVNSFYYIPFEMQTRMSI